MDYNKKRWLILIAACVSNLCTGAAYIWSIFASPMAEHFNAVNGFTGAAMLTAGSLAIVFTVKNTCGPLTQILTGILYPRLGPKWLMFIGGSAWGLAHILSSFTTSRLALVLVYGVLGGMGNGMAYNIAVNNTIKFFPEKRGLVGGLSTASYGLGAVILAPVANAFIRNYGVTNAFLFMGIGYIVINALCVLVIEPCPVDFVPNGYIPPAVDGNKTTVNKNWKEMLSDKRFYIMFLMLLCGAFSGMMMISQASPMAQKMIGASASSAAVIVSILSASNMTGRVVCGTFSDKFGRINTLTTMFVVSMIGLIVLYFSNSSMIFTIGIILVGLSFGAFMGVFPGFNVDQFGAKNNNLNYAIMMQGFSTASFFGPMAMASLLKSTGSYKPALVTAMGIAVFGLILTVVFRHITGKKDSIITQK